MSQSQHQSPQPLVVTRYPTREVMILTKDFVPMSLAQALAAAGIDIAGLESRLAALEAAAATPAGAARETKK